MSTMTLTHRWVKHVVTNVEVLTDDRGDPVVIVDPDAQAESEHDAAYGCDRCGVSMAEGLHTECELPL